MDNGIDTKGAITISVYPSEKGFVCTITEPKYSPLTAEYSVALTIAHGMVKMALERPDIIFDEGVDALANPQENDNIININEMMNKKKDRLN
jgi:hypothetical protein|tara:strand:+ start:151 stop:426 length:276 start_codon:yes stop_codon:yes gene_type:complete